MPHPTMQLKSICIVFHWMAKVNSKKLHQIINPVITGATEDMVMMGYCFGGAAVPEAARAGADRGRGRARSRHRRRGARDGL